MDKRRPTLVFLLIVTAIALGFCFILFRPFIYPLLSALIIGIIFFPVHNRIQRQVRWPGIAAAISTLLVTLIVTVPAALILIALIREVTNLRELIEQQSGDIGFSAYVSGLIERPVRWLSQYVDLSSFDLRASLLSRLKELSGFLVTQSFNLVGGITSFIVNSVIVLFTLFFIFREGKAMKRRLAAILPLNSAQVDKLFHGIENTIAGTVYGGLVVAAVQGALVGLALGVFGVESPVLWGVIAAFFALLPLVGTAAVWAPASLYLLLSGSWVKGVILIAWGSLVVGLVDNILRPLLIRGRVQMHTLLVFFAVFGGINVFGVLGLIIGPVIVAVTLTLLELLRDEGRVWVTAVRAAQEPGPPPPEVELTP